MTLVTFCAHCREYIRFCEPDSQQPRPRALPGVDRSPRLLGCWASACHALPACFHALLPDFRRRQCALLCCPLRTADLPEIRSAAGDAFAGSRCRFPVPGCSPRRSAAARVRLRSALLVFRLSTQRRSADLGLFAMCCDRTGLITARHVAAARVRPAIEAGLRILSREPALDMRPVLVRVSARKHFLPTERNSL